MTEAAQAVANPWDDSSFTEGGFFDDQDWTITAAKAVVFDFKGKAEPACCLHIEITPDNAETDEDKRDEYYRIGALDRFTPSSDGEKFLPVGAVTGMNKGAKAALFLTALKKAGFNLADLGKGISSLVGLHCHFNIVPMPPIKQEDGSFKEVKILVPTKIHDEPAANAKAGTKKKAAPKPAAAAKPAPAASASTPAAAAPAEATGAVSGDAEALLTNLIMELLVEKDGKAAKTAIMPKVFKLTQDAGLRKQIMSLVSNDAWLGDTAARGWTLTGGELSM